MTAKHLAQQIRNIKTNNLLSELERQLIERSVMGNLAEDDTDYTVEYTDTTTRNTRGGSTRREQQYTNNSRAI